MDRPGDAAGGGPGQLHDASPADPHAEGTAGHPTINLDDTVHQRHRLGILTITSRSRQTDFGYLRRALGLTSGNLSTHLLVLEDAGLIRVEKGYEGRKPRTWVSITRQGRAALAMEMAALVRLVRDHYEDQLSGPDGGHNEQD